MKHFSYEEKLRELWLFSWKKIRLQGDFVPFFQYFKEAYKKDTDFLQDL